MNISQNNQYSQKGNYNPNKSQKASKDPYQNSGYGSSGSSQQFSNNNYDFQNNYNNYPPQNMHYPIENHPKENERPLWSYREIKYDENKEPRNTEGIPAKKIAKSEINQQSGLDQLQDEDKKYFKNMKYQKVKVTKKVKNNEFIPPKVQKKGPVDDYEQHYKMQNYNNNEQMENKNNQINNYNDNNEENEENFENLNNEDEEGEIELEQKDIQEEYGKIMDYNEENYNNQNMNYNQEEPQKDINVEKNQIQKNEINDDELQKDNYDLDVENLAETHSQNGKDENDNNNIQVNQQMRPRLNFKEIIAQKVTDYIDEVKTFPEGSLESWNCVADYTPS